MSESDVLSILREAFYVCLKIAGPLLAASMIIGLIVAVFQAATQIHEQTLTFVPKLLIVAVIMIVCGSWIITIMNDFFKMIFEKIVSL
ncbi:MAG: flagellar biosynthesis protein FliQ [Ruminococcus sp.]|jgi:flagellar biosynthetic protein FliQ|nr:flagellar biosynthesis protein FliQ [Ruminococcus sp.]